MKCTGERVTQDLPQVQNHQNTIGDSKEKHKIKTCKYVIKKIRMTSTFFFHQQYYKVETFNDTFNEKTFNLEIYFYPGYLLPI